MISGATYDIGCNWKLAVEAFLELYHFKTVHPQTVAKMLRSDDTAIMLHSDGHSSLYMSYRNLSNDTDADMMQYRMDDIPPIKGLLSWCTEANASSLIFPNLIFNVEETGFPLLQFWPVSPDTTRYDEYWFGVDWGRCGPCACRKSHPCWSALREGRLAAVARPGTAEGIRIVRSPHQPRERTRSANAWSAHCAENRSTGY
jgi:phenylpropionate dioxygenase-like ring-hydroxylating dioxygenase large terminal subunit